MQAQSQIRVVFALSSLMICCVLLLHSLMISDYRYNYRYNLYKLFKVKRAINRTSLNISDTILLYNRVPKSGSEMFVDQIKCLQKRNNFKHIRLGGGFHQDRQLNTTEQERIVRNIEIKTAMHLDEPISLDRHVYFINFSEFRSKFPMYINVIRDPVEKMASRYYYKTHIREPGDLFDECVEKNMKECQLITGQGYDLSIPYFCGHADWCKELNNEGALRKAKSNVEKYFRVVGVLEYLNESLAVFENKLPRYFLGLQETYFANRSKTHKNANDNNPRIIRTSTRRILKSKLKSEYDFYYFIRSRLLKEFSLISNESNTMII